MRGSKKTSSITKEVRTNFSQDLTEEEQQYLKVSYRIIPRTQMAKKLNVKKMVLNQMLMELNLTLE